MFVKMRFCVKVALSPSKKNVLFASMKAIGENCFLFHLKCSFRYHEAYVLTFWSCRRNGLISNIRLISKFRTSQSDWKTILIHILSKISRSKDIQTITFRQLIEYIKIFFKNHQENEAERLFPDLFFSFENILYEVKASGLQLNFKNFR